MPPNSALVYLRPMNALVTGSNRGIGLEFCKQLSKEDGYKITAVCRQPSTELKSLGCQIEDGIDVTNPQALQKLSEKLGKAQYDLLVLNAGIFLQDNISAISKSEIEKQLLVNAVGPVLCVSALLPHLKKGTKIALITSRMGSIADNNSGGYYGYRMSKAALNAAGVSMAHDLRAKGISVVILHPGYVKTDMTDHQGEITPTQAVSGMRKVIARSSLDNTGAFWHTNGEPLPW